MNTASDKKLKKELESFQTLWKGGYYEGTVTDELFPSGYGSSGYMSVLYATYLKCIKPYIHPGTVALEIGPGRGGWTKTMLDAKEIVTLDALSAEHNKFWEYIGKQEHVKYIQVNDFSCRELPDNHFNYMFSFGCLCHVSFEGITEYATNLYPKMKPGSNCFWMIADYDQFNAVAEREELDIYTRLFKRSKSLPLYLLYKLMRKKPALHNKNEDNEPRPGRWYHAGLDRCCAMLESKGYRIVEKDTGTVHRDPIIHFTKD